MCSPELVMAGTSAGAGMFGAYGQLRQGAFDKAMAAYNARVDLNLAKEVEQAGTEAMIEKNVQAEQLKGKQKAIAAARGVVVGEGTPLRLQEDVDFIRDIDIMNIKRNVERKAGALKTSAALTKLGGEFASEQAELKALSTLLGSSAKAFSQSGLGSPAPETAVDSRWYDLAENQVDAEELSIDVPGINWEKEYPDIYAR